jgi:hypothetical protein
MNHLVRLIPPGDRLIPPGWNIPGKETFWEVRGIPEAICEGSCFRLAEAGLLSMAIQAIATLPF